MTTAEKPAPTAARRAEGSRAGYVVSIVLNAVGLFIVNNLLSWDLLPFLTDRFSEVLPIINLSLVATIVVNVAYLWYDARWFASLSQLGLLGISMVVALRMYGVFPFDFSAYAFDWALLTRALLIVGMVGIGIAMLAEAVKLGTAAARTGAAR